MEKSATDNSDNHHNRNNNNDNIHSGNRDHVSPENKSAPPQRRLVAVWVKGGQQPPAAVAGGIVKSAIMNAAFSGISDSIAAAASSAADIGGRDVTALSPKLLQISTLSTAREAHGESQEVSRASNVAPLSRSQQRDMPAASAGVGTKEGCLPAPSTEAVRMCTRNSPHFSFGSSSLTKCGNVKASSAMTGSTRTSEERPSSRAKVSIAESILGNYRCNELDPSAGRSTWTSRDGIPSSIRDSPDPLDSPRHRRQPLAELPPGGSCSCGGGGCGGGDGGASGGRLAGECNVGGEVVLTEERLEAVRYYLRDDDPIFVRSNLKRLIEGTLVRLEKGDTVTVARRCRGGQKNEGGSGRVMRVLPNFYYDIRYAVSGVEKGVDGCFIEKITLGTRRPRGSTPRCPDCHSFLHECTCEGFVGLAATANAMSEGLSPPEARLLLPSASPEGSSLARSLKRPRTAIGKDATAAITAPRKQGDKDRTRDNPQGRRGGESLSAKSGDRMSRQDEGKEVMDVDVSRKSGGGFVESGQVSWRPTCWDIERDRVNVHNRAPSPVADEAAAATKGRGKGGGPTWAGWNSRNAGNKAHGDVAIEDAMRTATTVEHTAPIETSARTSSADDATRSALALERVCSPPSKRPDGSLDANRDRASGNQTSISSEGQQIYSRDEEGSATGSELQIKPRLASADINALGKSDVFEFPGTQEIEEETARTNVLADGSTTPVGNASVADRERGEALWVDPDGVQDDTAGVVMETAGSAVSSGNNTVSSIRRKGASATVPTRHTESAGTGDHSKPGNSPVQQSSEWRPHKGDLVEVERRMTPGVNKPGGTARVVKVDSMTGAVDVRYVVEGGWERGIDPIYVTPAVLDLSEVRRPTLGRCQHCGSLRVDCRQGCEYYTAPPPRSAPPIPSAHLLSPAIRQDSASFDTSPMNSESFGGAETRRKHGGRLGRNRRHRSPTMDRSAIEVARRDEREKRRRRVPDDWDEEGVPMPGSEQEGGVEDQEDVDETPDRDHAETSGSDRGKFASRDRGTRGSGDRRWSERQDWDQFEFTSLGRNRRNSSTDTSTSSGGEDRHAVTSGIRTGRQSRRWETGDETDTDSVNAYSDVEVFDVRNAALRNHRAQHGGDGASDQRYDTERDSRYKNLAAPSRKRKVQRKRIGDYDSSDVAGGAGRNGGPALFLMPEGEEASRALPADILDPTRGLKDPAVLRRELTRSLHRMEGCDAEELERDVPCVCRRLAQAAATSGDADDDGDDSTLETDVTRLSTRIKESLRRLDIANNIYVRLDKLDARWREGIEGENAWHRLDRLSVRLEEWRREVDKAVRAYTNAAAWTARNYSSELSDESNHSSVADEDDVSSALEHAARGGNSSEDFEMRTATRLPDVMHGRQRGKRKGRVSNGSQTQHRSAAGARGSDPATRHRKIRENDRRDGGASSSDTVGSDKGSEVDDFVIGIEKSVDSTRNNGRPRRRGTKRSRNEVSSGRRHGRTAAVRTQQSKGSRTGQRIRDGGSGGGGKGEGWTSDDDEGVGTYLAGLDYNMAVEPAEDKARRDDTGSWIGSLSPLSSAARASFSSSSSRSRSRSRSPPLSLNTSGRNGGGCYVGKSGVRQTSAGSAKRRRRARREDGRGSKIGGGSSLLRGRTRGERGGSGDGGRSKRRTGNGSTEVVSPNVRTGKRRDRNIFGDARTAARGSVPFQERRNRRNGPSMEVALFRQRLAEQEADGRGLLSHSARGKTNGDSWHNGYIEFGEMSERPSAGGVTTKLGMPALRRVGLPSRPLPPPGPPRLRNLVEDLLPTPRPRGLARFRTLYSETAATREVNLDGIVFGIIDISDPSFGGLESGKYVQQQRMEDGIAVGQQHVELGMKEEWGYGAGGGEAGGALGRAMKALPQKMADLEELARECFDDEAEALAKECCQTMAVIGENLRALNTVASCSVSSSALRNERSRKVLAAVRTHVLRLAAAAAPGSNGRQEDSTGNGEFFPGVSLTNFIALSEKLRGGVRNFRNSTDSSSGVRGSVILVGACTAFHIHLLEWLQIGHDDAGDEGRDRDDTAGVRDSSQNFPGALLDFARRLVLDLLCIYEARLTKTSHVPASSRDMASDSLAELWCATMVALDGTGGATYSLRPAATVSIPGLAQRLVGFWGILLDIVSRPNITNDSVHSSWKAGLSSELVWRVMIHAVRLQLLRDGYDDDATMPTDTSASAAASGDAGATTSTNSKGAAEPAECAPEETVEHAAAMALERRSRQTTTALWHCVRLLLAASPFAAEFAAGPAGQVSSAVAATAQATVAVAALTRPGRYSSSSTETTGRAMTPPPITAVEETFRTSGMVARVVLERVLALARIYPPEAGSQGVVEKLWEGAQRLSRTLCAFPTQGSSGRRALPAEEDVEARDQGEREVLGDEDRVVGGRQCHEDREARRLQSARKLGQRPCASPSVGSERLGYLLASATMAWCLPAHEMCRLPRAALERAGTIARAGVGVEGRRGFARGGEGDYEALCSLTSLLTEEHAMRLPDGLKRRRLANGLLKAKYTSPKALEGQSAGDDAGGDDDDMHALAPTRVLLGIALGLARAGLAADAAKELVKAAAVRPRNVSADMPRDKSIALIAPAAAAFCIALPRPGCSLACSPTAGGGGNDSVRATLFGVLAGCMKDAVELFARVIDGAGRLGQAVNPKRLERPRAAVGLAASCILLALRHLGPQAHSSPSSSANCTRALDRARATLCTSRDLGSAISAVGAFVEVLGRSLEKRFLEHLGRPALTVILSALLHCWPSVNALGIVDNPTATAAVMSSSPAGCTNASSRDRGYAMGWWKDRPVFPAPPAPIDSGFFGQEVPNTFTPTTMSTLALAAAVASPSPGSSVRSHDNAPKTSSGVRGSGDGGKGSEGTEAGRGGDGVQDEREEEENKMDEYGSWDDFVDNAELEALLSGGTQKSTTRVNMTQTQQDTEAEQQYGCPFAAETAAAEEAQAAAAAAAVTKENEEREKMWLSLADGARMHVLPRLPEIVKRAWTIARYAQDGLSSSSSVQAASTRNSSYGVASSHGGGVGIVGKLSGCKLSGCKEPAPIPQPTSATESGFGQSLGDSDVDADVVLRLHASAALVALRGKIATTTTNRGGNDSQNCTDYDYCNVREKYLDLHRMAQNPLVPQQRLLAPAFFCVTLESAGEADGVGGGGDNELEESGPHPGGFYGLRRPGFLLQEALEGREWEVLQLWMQAALDPMAFPAPPRRRGEVNRVHGHRFPRRGGDWAGGGSGAGLGEPSHLVRERFEVFTHRLARAFGFEKGSMGGSDIRREGRPFVDADEVRGIFEKRLIRFEPSQWAALSKHESKVLVRVLDLQSVIAHCGELWSAALVISGPASMREADRKRIKDRVVKLVHACIKSLKRFLPEVFPRGHTHGTATNGDDGDENTRAEDDAGSSGGVSGNISVSAGRYGSRFRHLYGHAAYSLVAFLTRMCTGALKGRPLRDLVETCFEAIARPFHAVNSSGPHAAGRCGCAGSGAAAGAVAAGVRGRGEPHPELAALAVMHASDLFQCFSEMPMTVNPVADWIKNINDHAINGTPSRSTAAAAALPPPPPLICSLAAGLRGDLQYPSIPRPAFMGRSSSLQPTHDSAHNVDDNFVGLASVAALAAPPRTTSAALAKGHLLARMRLEVLGDRKLRMARFLLEAATASTSPGPAASGEGSLGGHHIRVAFSTKSVNTTRSILVMVAEVFRRRCCRELPRAREEQGEGGGGARLPDVSIVLPGAQSAAEAVAAEMGGTAQGAHSPCPPLSMSSPASSLPPPLRLQVQRDIVTLIRPVYSLLGQALLGEPGPARRLGRHAIAAAVALSTAALDASSSVLMAPADERRVAECFAQVVVLAVATKLDTFLAAIEGRAAVDGVRGGYISGGAESSTCGATELEFIQALGDFGPREVELERRLREMGAWDVHGEWRGWPHNAVLPLITVPSVGISTRSEEKQDHVGREDEDTVLPALLAEADEMVWNFRSGLRADQHSKETGELVESGRWWRRVEGALLLRVAACRAALYGNSTGRGAESATS